MILSTTLLPSLIDRSSDAIELSNASAVTAAMARTISPFRPIAILLTFVRMHARMIALGKDEFILVCGRLLGVGDSRVEQIFTRIVWPQ